MSGYNILVLDDNPQRLSEFRRYLVNINQNVLTLVSTAHGAITKLKLYQYAIIFLDYDLDQFGGNVKNTGTGMDVVNWIVQNKHLFTKSHFIIQSTNPAGGPLMYTTLKAAGLQVEYRPRVWEDAAFLRKL